jgi:hypothetical protein
MYRRWMLYVVLFSLVSINLDKALYTQSYGVFTLRGFSIAEVESCINSQNKIRKNTHDSTQF